MERLLALSGLMDRYILWDDPVFKKYYLGFWAALILFFFLSLKLARMKPSSDDTGFVGAETGGIESVPETPAPAAMGGGGGKDSPAPAPAPSLPAPSVPAPAPVLFTTAVDGKTEDLERRVREMEAAGKKDPLFLDPLLKRVHAMEQKIEELASKPIPASPVAEGVKGDDLKALSQSLQDSIARTKNEFQSALAELERKFSAVPKNNDTAKHSVSEAEFRVWRETLETNTFERLQGFEKMIAQAPTGGPAGVTPGEFKSLVVKVDGLQKILEHIAEDPGAKHS